MRKQRRAAQSRGWLMNMWDKALGMCSSSSSSVPLQSHLVKQLKHRAGRVSFSTSSSVQGGFAGGGWSEWQQCCSQEGPQQCPGSCAGGREPHRAAGQGLPSQPTWKPSGAGHGLGLGLGLTGLRWKDASGAQPCLGAGEILVPLKLPWTPPDPQG